MSVSPGAIDAFTERIEGYEVSSPSTLRKYAKWARRFETWKPEGEPDHAMVRDFDAFLADEEVESPWDNARGPSPPDSYAYRSRLQAASAVKLWSKHHYDARIEEEVTAMVKGEPAPFEPTVLGPSEVDQVLHDAAFACDNPDCEAALKVGYDAIMRGAEVAAVRRGDVDREAREIEVRSVKGSNRVWVPLGDRAWSALERHMDANPDRDRLFRNSYDRAWKPAALNAHIRRKHCEAGSHALFRHSAITNRLRAGEDFGQVFIRARHSNPDMTLKYVDKAGVDAPDWTANL